MIPHSLKALVILGPPGSGKSSQAELLAAHFRTSGRNFVHFDLGEEIEKLVNDPEKNKDPVVARQKQLFQGGRLADIDWVVKISEERLLSLAGQAEGIILSGEPRDLAQARRLLPFLEKITGGTGLIFIWLEVSEEMLMRRLRERDRPELDEPAVIKIRLKEFEEKTRPVLEWLKASGRRVLKINGEGPAPAVFKELISRINGFA